MTLRLVGGGGYGDRGPPKGAKDQGKGHGKKGDKGKVKGKEGRGFSTPGTHNGHGRDETAASYTFGPRGDRRGPACVQRRVLEKRARTIAWLCVESLERKAQ